MKHNEQLGISNDLIQQIALDNGFQLKDQPDGTKDLHPYVYDFARSLMNLTRSLVNPARPNTDELIKGKALDSGFILKEQADGTKIIHAYVYDCAHSLTDLARPVTIVDNQQDLRGKQKSITEWSDQTFGDKSPLQIATRMNNEVAELLTGLANKPDAIEHHAGECADVLIMLLQVAEKLGVDIEAELDRKMHVNRNRKWAVNAAGKAQHV